MKKNPFRLFNQTSSLNPKFYSFVMHDPRRGIPFFPIIILTKTFFFSRGSRWIEIQDRLNVQEAREKGVEQPGVELGKGSQGVLSSTRGTTTAITTTTTRADLYKRNDVSSREGVGRERRQSGALEKRLSAVKNAGELLVCLARYKRPGAALSGRSTPPLPGHRYFGAIRAVKKKKGGKKTTPFREKTRPFSYSSSSSCSSGLHCPQSGLSFVWAGEF